jgi:hypothetical protein
MSEPSRRELLNVVYKLDLYSFVERSFGVLEPGNRFMPAASLELLSTTPSRRMTRNRQPSATVFSKPSTT